MKKILYFAAFAVALSACVKEEVTSPKNEGELQTVTFQALASPQTKTTLVDGTKIYWCSGDQISVMGAAAPFTNSLAEGETAASVDFTGQVAAADIYYAAYPASAVVSWKETVANVKTTMRQNAVAGSFADGLNITVANTTSQEKTFTFKNVLGYVKVPVTSTNIKSVIITANGGEKLYGEVTVDCAAEEPSAVAVSGSNVVTLSSSSALAAGDYYVALIPGTYSQGLTFDFVGTDNKVASKSINTSIELKAGHINPISVSGLTWNDPAGDSENVIWKGKYVTGSWDNGMMELAYGGYNWANAKAGDVLKIHGGATDPATTPTIGLRNGNWQKVAGLNDYYNNPGQVFSVTLTEEMINDLSSNSGLVVQGDHYYFNLIELIPDTGEEEEPGEDETNSEITVFEGEGLLTSWSDNVNLQYFRSVVSGSVLYVETTSDASATLKLANPVDSWPNVSGTGYYNPAEGKAVTKIELTDEAVAELRTNGLILQGQNTVVTKVYFTYPADAVLREKVLDTDIMLNDFEEGDGHSAAWDNSWDGYATGNASEGCLDVTESGKAGWLVNCNHVEGPVVENANGYDVLVDVYVPKGWYDDGTNKYQIILDDAWYWVGQYMFSSLIGNDTWQTVRVSKLTLPETIDFSDVNEKNQYGSNGISTESGSSLPVGMKLDNFRLSLKK